MLTFIVDPNAGGKQGLRIWQKLERRLVRRHVEFQVYVTGAHGEPRALSERLTSSAAGGGDDLILAAVGGDGLMNEILDGAHLSDRIFLGFVPLERSDLARGLRLPANAWACMKRIIDFREVRLMDYGIVDYGTEEPGHRRFAVSCGCGYDAERREEIRAAGTHKSARPLLDGLRRMQEDFDCFLGAQTVKGELVLDNEQRIELNHIFLVAAQIQPTEAGGMRLARKVLNTDGKLTVSILHNRSKLQQFRVLKAPGLQKPDELAGVRNYNCEELKVKLEEPMLLHADGEMLGAQREFTVRCMKQKLKFLC